MPAPPFLFANIVGALMWTSVVGYLSFHRVGHWIVIVIGVVAVTAIVVGITSCGDTRSGLKRKLNSLCPVPWLHGQAPTQRVVYGGWPSELQHQLCLRRHKR